MNILLINHYAGSPEHGMEYRPFYFAREWVRAGHQVLIVAADFSHLRRVNPCLSGTLMQESWDGVDYLWAKTPPYQGNGLSRVRKMMTFMLRLRGACARPIAAFAPDVVIASSTYTWDNWIAAHYAKMFGAKYVYEVHDLWPLSPMELGGMSARNPFIWSLQRARTSPAVMHDRVVSLLPGATRHLVAHGMHPDRFAYIPNGVVLEEWEDMPEVPESHAAALREIRGDVRCLVGYVGGHGLSNALDVLVEVGADPRLKDIGIVCVGDGAEKKRLEEKAHGLGGNVRFLPPVPKRSVPALLSLFDVLYIGWSRSPLYRFGISPNKLFEYMMAGVPILHGVEATNDPSGSPGAVCRSPRRTRGALRRYPGAGFDVSGGAGTDGRFGKELRATAITTFVPLRGSSLTASRNRPMVRVVKPRPQASNRTSSMCEEATPIPLVDLAAHLAPLAATYAPLSMKCLPPSVSSWDPDWSSLKRRSPNTARSPFAYGVSSGTDALLAALMALEVKPGDEIVTSPYTFFATAGAISRMQASTEYSWTSIPIPTTWIATFVEQALSPKTRGVVPVHLFGQMADLDPLLALARDRGLWIVEDAAQAIGADFTDAGPVPSGRSDVSASSPPRTWAVWAMGGR